MYLGSLTGKWQFFKSLLKVLISNRSHNHSWDSLYDIFKAEIEHWRYVHITYRNIAFCGLDFIANYSYEIFNNDLLYEHTICCICAFLPGIFLKEGLSEICWRYPYF